MMVMVLVMMITNRGPLGVLYPSLNPALTNAAIWNVLALYSAPRSSLTLSNQHQQNPATRPPVTSEGLQSDPTVQSCAAVPKMRGRGC